MEMEQTIDTRRISSVSDRIHKAYEGSSQKEGPCPYIDTSILGHKCDRYIWLTFRWVFFYQTPREGRVEMVRKRNEREKEYVLHNLDTIGIPKTYTFLDKQADLDFGSHVHGVPDGYLPQGTGSNESTSPHSLLIDSCDTNDWLTAYREGIPSQKYCQLQLEMYGFKYILKMPCDRGLYYAICKDDDRIYTERVALEKEDAESLIQRGKYLALSDNLPERTSCHDCKDCPYRDFCYPEEGFGDIMYPEINCRTCCHSTPKEDGTWFCEYWDDTIPSLTAQHHACDAHCVNPALVPTWELLNDRCTNWSACYNIHNIGQVMNGIDGNTTTSIMRAVLKKEGREDEYIDKPYTIEAEAVPDPNDIIPF